VKNVINDILNRFIPLFFLFDEARVFVSAAPPAEERWYGVADGVLVSVSTFEQNDILW